MTVEVGGKAETVGDASPMPTMESQFDLSMTEMILGELRILNRHMEIVTGESLTEEDLE